MNKVTYLICIVFVVAGIGCASLSYMVTPAELDSKAIDYAVESGVVDANAFSGYHNLEKAIRLEVAVKNAYETKSLALQQMMEKNQLDYTMLNDLVVRNTKEARSREEQLFAQDGLLTMGLTLAGFGGFTGLIGLGRKRPGDLTPQDMEQAVGTIKGEVTKKDRQLIELVKGVQGFLDLDWTWKPESGDIDVVGNLKEKLASAQSADTKQLIGQIKATL